MYTRAQTQTQTKTQTRTQAETQTQTHTQTTKVKWYNMRLTNAISKVWFSDVCANTLPLRSVIWWRVFSIMDFNSETVRCVFDMYGFRCIVLQSVCLHVADFLSVMLRDSVDKLSSGVSCYHLCFRVFMLCVLLKVCVCVCCNHVCCSSGEPPRTRCKTRAPWTDALPYQNQHPLC